MEDCCADNISTIDRCPICNNIGEVVSNATVKSLLKNKVELTDNYSICLTSDCEAVYFNSNELYKKNEVKVGVWTKTSPETRIVCYCSGTSEVEVRNAIETLKLKSLKEVVNNTTAMDNSDCEHNSPTGKCCSRQIRDILNEYK